MSDKKFLGILVVILAVFLVWKFGVFGLGQNRSGLEANFNGLDNVKEDGVFKHTNLNLSFAYDKNLFTVLEKVEGASLSSPYYVVNNLSGDPKNDSKHPFSITIQVVNKEMLGYIKTLPYGSNFMTMFPGGTVDSFTADSGFAEKVMVNGKVAHKFTVGVEGTNADYYFVSLDKNKTAVITVSYFTDFLASAVKPGPFSEVSERAAVKTVLDSLHF